MYGNPVFESFVLLDSKREASLKTVSARCFNFYFQTLFLERLWGFPYSNLHTSHGTWRTSAWRVSQQLLKLHCKVTDQYNWSLPLSHGSCFLQVINSQKNQHQQKTNNRTKPKQQLSLQSERNSSPQISRAVCLAFPLRQPTKQAGKEALTYAL